MIGFIVLINSPFTSYKLTPEQISVIKWSPGASYSQTNVTSLKNSTSAFDYPIQPISSETKKANLHSWTLRRISKQIKIPDLSSPPIPVGFPWSLTA